MLYIIIPNLISIFIKYIFKTLHRISKPWEINGYYYKNGLRGYRLTAAAKKLLLEHNPERFSFYLSGACATNHIRSEPEQRLRLHRVSQTLITMRNANVSIFRDEKLGVFRPGETAIGSICTPAFYTSREIKEMGTTFVKIRGARSVGVLLTPQHIHVVYNMGNALMKWSYKAEMRTKALIDRKSVV